VSRAKVLQFRLSEYEFEQLRQEAEKQGVPMADMLRKYIASLPKPVIG
jgi:predicted DNA binding CopG/RHH family protein